MEIEFIGFIRPDLKFRSMESLAAQITDDCAKAKDILNRVTDSPPPGNA
jgi:FAD synthase